MIERPKKMFNLYGRLITFLATFSSIDKYISSSIKKNCGQQVGHSSSTNVRNNEYNCF